MLIVPDVQISKLLKFVKENIPPEKRAWAVKNAAPIAEILWTRYRSTAPLPDASCHLQEVVHSDCEGGATPERLEYLRGAAAASKRAEKKRR